MPLPPDCTLSLLGYSRPGDTVHSKPKQAIIIRLSTEILDALESSPDAKLDFSENPILWAGPTHFAMNAAKENLHHELYLRAASVTKKNAPLKLHANVVGKFQVERQLDNDVRSRVRQSAKTLKEQRQERGIIQLETPPAPGRFSSKASKKSAAGIKSKLSRSTNNLAKISSRDPATYKAKNAAPVPIQRRMIQLLAVGDRTADEIVKQLGGPDCTPSDRSRILDLLEQLAEAYLIEVGVNTKPSKLYRLKLKSWVDVRPIEWEWSSEHERLTVSANFERTLRRMGIPETDPMWKYSLHKDEKGYLSSLTKQSGSTSRVAGGSLKTEPVPQRAPAAIGTKEKRTKSGKINSGNEEISRDGTIQPAKSLATHSKIQVHETLPLPPVPKASAPLRKPPGSGFRSGKASTPAASPPAVENPIRGHQDIGSKAQNPPSLLHGQSTTASRQLEPNGTTRRTHKVDADTHPGPKRASESMGKGGGDSRPVNVEGTNQKRRTITRDLDGNDVFSTREPVPKKRRVDRNLVDIPCSPSIEHSPGDQVSKKVVKKLEPSTGHKKKDNAIPPPRHQAKTPSPSSSLLLDNSTSGQNANSKPVTSNRRRRSPVYTSSDDDSESISTSKDITHQALPSDHASLRRRYKKSYGEYLTAFYKLVTVRDKIDGILGTQDANDANFASDTDVELMDPEEFQRLCSRHKRLRDELESIQQAFSQSNGRVIAA